MARAAIENLKISMKTLCDPKEEEIEEVYRFQKGYDIRRHVLELLCRLLAEYDPSLDPVFGRIRKILLIKVFEVLLLFPFMGWIVKLACKVVPGKDAAPEDEYELLYIGKGTMMVPTCIYSS